MKSHLVSEVLLRRFAINNKIQLNYLNGAPSKPKHPSKIGYIEIVHPLIKALENEWCIIESQIGNIFPYIDDESLLSNAKNVEVVKKFIALHYVRNYALIVLQEKYEMDYFLQFIHESIVTFPYRYEEIIENIHKYRAEWLVNINNAEVLAEIFQSNPRKIYEHIQEFDLEFGVSIGSRNLILPDNPVMNLSIDGKLGILNGVGILNSVDVAMPMGPKHLVTLITKGKSHGFLPMGDMQVDEVNRKLRLNSLNEYYSTI